MDEYSEVVSEMVTIKLSKAERFVGYVIERVHKDNGFAARLKRADNPNTEYQSWELLADFGIDLEKEWERLPFCTIAAALGRTKPEANGRLPLGRAIAACYEDGCQSYQAKARLRRLLACTTSVEACRILRPILTLMASRGVIPDFSQLLEQLLWYSGNNQARIRACWAQTFYRRTTDIVASKEEVTHV